MKSTLTKTSKASKATTTKKTACAILSSPAIWRGIIKASAAVLEKDSKGADLEDYLTPRQMNRLDKEAVSRGFKCASEYVEDFLKRAIKNMLEEHKAAVA